MFVSIEGMDGAGKTTIINRLKAEYIDHAVYVRDPGTTVVAEKIRDIVRGGGASPLTELYLFLAARQDLYDQIIKPNLDLGHMVISDRWSWSTYVYQGIIRGLKDHVLAIPETTIQPDLVIYLDLSPETSQMRLTNRNGEAPDEFDALGTTKKVIMRDAYLQLAKNPTAVVIDASQELGEVWVNVVSAIEAARKKENYLISKGVEYGTGRKEGDW